MKKTSRELSEALGVIDTTWRKWSREFLPPDNAAGFRCGVKRMYGPQQSFIVWAGGKLINDKLLTYAEAKKVLKNIEVLIVALLAGMETSYKIVVFKYHDDVVVYPVERPREEEEICRYHINIEKWFAIFKTKLSSSNG